VKGKLVFYQTYYLVLELFEYLEFYEGGSSLFGEKRERKKASPYYCIINARRNRKLHKTETRVLEFTTGASSSPANKQKQTSIFIVKSISDLKK
jgi:hypothetical protein